MPVNPRVAAIVADCWKVDPDVCKEVSEPLANLLDRYLPEPVKEVVEAGLDPFDVAAGIWRIAAHCQRREALVLAELKGATGAIPNAKPHAAPPSSLEPDIDVSALILERQEQELLLDDEEPVPV